MMTEEGLMMRNGKIRKIMVLRKVSDDDDGVGDEFVTK